MKVFSWEAFIERVCVIFQILCYTFTIYALNVKDNTWNYITGEKYINSSRELALIISLSIIIPIVIRWIFTGRSHIIPLTQMYITKTKEWWQEENQP